MTLKQSLFQIFCMVTTAQVIFMAVSAWLWNDHRTMYMADLWQLPFIGLISSLPTILFMWLDADDFKVRLLHGLLTLVIVFGALLYFYPFTLLDFMLNLSFFGVTYVGILVYQLRESKKIADLINQQLTSQLDEEEDRAL